MDERLGPMETAVCMGFDAMRICLGGKPQNFTIQQVEQWMQIITTPSHQQIADSLEFMADGSTKCPVCARTYIHSHTPEELIIYRNGVKYGRSITCSPVSAQPNPKRGSPPFPEAEAAGGGSNSPDVSSGQTVTHE